MYLKLNSVLSIRVIPVYLKTYYTNLFNVHVVL